MNDINETMKTEEKKSKIIWKENIIIIKVYYWPFINVYG